MQTDRTMLERWFFYQDATGLWKWARLDVLGTVLAHSGASFETRNACVEHAILNGYEEGRRSPSARASPTYEQRETLPGSPP